LNININEIYNIDCRDFIPQLPDNYINLVVTSPPYNVDLSYDEYNDSLSYKNYLLFLEDVFKKLYNKMVDDGRICINIGNTKNGHVVNAFDLSTIMQNIGYNNYTTIVWNKNQTSSRTAWGSFNSPSCPSFPTSFEYILVFYKKSMKLLHKGISDLTKEEFIKWSLALWEFTGEIKDVKHPAPFPIELVKRCLKMFSYKEDIVYDPFGGSGTTALTCKIYGRKYIVTDISKEYCDNSINRVKDNNRFF
jgi:site-specific DNA-methyltransferase (adenine-specific)